MSKSTVFLWGRFISVSVILLMEEILHQLLYMKPHEKCEILHVNWCRISSIHSIHKKKCISSAPLCQPCTKTSASWRAKSFVRTKTCRQSWEELLSVLTLLVHAFLIKKSWHKNKIYSFWTREGASLQSYNNCWIEICFVEIWKYSLTFPT